MKAVIRTLSLVLALAAAVSVQAATISALKAKTAAMIKAHGPALGSVDAPPVIWRVKGAPTEFQDSPLAPRMVVIPAGEFTLGIAPGADGKDPFPLHRARIAHPLAFGKYPVTVGQFTRFVNETGYDPGTQCQIAEDGTRDNHNWRSPNFKQTDDSPVVCVNFDDAQAYVAWLSKKTGHAYRLPSSAEYEYANRGGTTTTYWWGADLGKTNASCGGACGSVWDNKQPPPAGSFAPNAFGLYDTTGNIWVRTQDCWSDSAADLTSDGKPFLGGDCTRRVLRGGGYRSGPFNLRSGIRLGNPANIRFNDDGFRIVRDL